MNILLTGASGLIGHALSSLLTTQGHRVVAIVRSKSHSTHGQIVWNPEAGMIDKNRLEDFNAVIHLAGETIAARWTAQKKARILASRVKSTRLLCETLTQVQSRPKVLVSASAIGYYGNRGDEILDERSSPGSLFLSQVSAAWEDATERARQAGIRVVNLRMGLVLSKSGGGLATMLLPFKLGVGGRVGSGEQYMSWVAIDDVVGAISHSIHTDSLQGPVNAVAPNPVTNGEFTKALGRVLRRPTIFPLPEIAARLLFGEMGENLLLASTRVIPSQLIDSSYQFLFPDLEGALRHVLDKD